MRLLQFTLRHPKPLLSDCKFSLQLVGAGVGLLESPAQPLESLALRSEGVVERRLHLAEAVIKMFGVISQSTESENEQNSQNNHGCVGTRRGRRGVDVGGRLPARRRLLP